MKEGLDNGHRDKDGKICQTTLHEYLNSGK